jgi:hypothetical protein
VVLFCLPLIISLYLGCVGGEWCSFEMLIVCDFSFSSFIFACALPLFLDMDRRITAVNPERVENATAKRKKTSM